MLQDVTNDRRIIATPKTREDLVSFAESNGGNLDLVLMQMSVQFGYKIALEELKKEQDENGRD